MIIDKNLFGQCYCPCESIGRISLKADKEHLLPKQLLEIAKELDGEDYYEVSAFCIEIVESGALIYYSSLDNGFKEICICSNYFEALEHYKKNASKVDLEETYKGWSNY